MTNYFKAVPAMFQKGINILRSDAGAFVCKNFFQECKEHPNEVFHETNKFLARWMFGKQEVPPQGTITFEPHSHSHFSDGAELSDVVDRLFAKNIGIWSLTDHNNSNGFDALISGEYRLGKGYELDVSPDKRFLTIHHKDGKQLMMLRSIECKTDVGEINIHGYEGKEPKEMIPLDEAAQLTHDRGGFFIINHPYAFIGLGYHGDETVECAIELGATAIEMNGTEIPPEIFSPLRARRIGKQHKLPVITAGDAHGLFMYGLSGIAFDSTVYHHVTDEYNGDEVQAIKSLIDEELYDTYLNYLTPWEFKKFFSFDGYAQVKLDERK